MAEELTETLYQKRIPIYPRSVKGRFRALKYGILALAYGVYFFLPWVRWERPNAPDQAIIFDIPNRHFYIFDLIVAPQDIFWLAGFLMIAALLLFFVTGIAGRVFCGYFCFQTLWTDVFILIEQLVQGERPARMRLDQQTWNGEKLLKKGLTFVLWLIVAFLTGLTFTLYWANAPELVGQMLAGEAPFAAYSTTLFLTATTFVMAGLAREQVCTYMCPYARFQSAMFDRDTLIVSYDQKRGEARNKIAKDLKTREQRQAQNVGDCIECGYCVQVCPTGIDIRNGLQYQCISCALCIDACDTIMDKLNWPRGLIRYTSDNELEGKQTRIIKPKTIAYGIILLGAVAVLIWSIASRSLYNAAIEQIRQPLAVTLSDGKIQNSYEIKLNNKITRPMSFTIVIEGLPDAELDLGTLESVNLGPQQRLRVLARVRSEPGAVAEGQNHFVFVITPQGDVNAPPVELPAQFYRP